METLVLLHASVAALIWLALLLLPFRPWSTRERLEASPPERPEDLSDITVLIPARNESAVIRETLEGVRRQGSGISVVLVDDRSDDGTAGIVRRSGLARLRLVEGAERPGGWTGKLWAQEQGLRHVETPLVLLLDADIRLAPGIAAALRRKLADEDLDFVSLLAAPPTRRCWDRLLMPAFVYFFKLLYPFALANAKTRLVAAAAGGCILTRASVLEAVGAFGSLKDALIDDCSLARKVKERGFRTWIGLTRHVESRRPYEGLRGIWEMVARTAYTQLRYSPLLLLVCTWIMLTAFGAPLAGLAAGPASTRIVSGVALAAMGLSYAPVLRYYGLSPAEAAALPVSAGLYLAMTWTSALRYLRGVRSSWRGRVYGRDLETKDGLE